MNELINENMDICVDENIEMVEMFDDCENGFLAKKNKFLTWLLS